MPTKRTFSYAVSSWHWRLDRQRPLIVLMGVRISAPVPGSSRSFPQAPKADVAKGWEGWENGHRRR